MFNDSDDTICLNTADVYVPLRFDMLWIIISLFGCTYLYSLRENYYWTTPYTLLIDAMLLIFANFYSSNLKRKQFLDPTMAGWIWLAWLVYGTLFKETLLIFDWNEAITMGIPQSAVITGLVALSYFKNFQENTFLLLLLIAGFMITMTVPFRGSISFLMGRVGLFSKVTFFFAIYILIDIDMTLRNGQNDINEKLVKIIQSSWILIVSFYFLLFVLIQIIPIILNIKNIILKRERRRKPILPLSDKQPSHSSRKNRPISQEAKGVRSIGWSSQPPKNSSLPTREIVRKYLNSSNNG